MIDHLLKMLRCTAGATAVEYGLILCLVVIAAMIAILGLADTTIGMWDNIADNVMAH
jgi:pilus assembly protein Flp/PilA